MIDKHLSPKRFTFACHTCDHTWSVDYRVQHVEDGHGHDREYYLRSGLPVVSPTGEHAVLCPRRGHDEIDTRPDPWSNSTVPERDSVAVISQARSDGVPVAAWVWAACWRAVLGSGGSPVRPRGQ